jgi:hypothetical protein
MKKYIPLLVISIAALTIILIPLKAISYGYLPVDDALRHAGKVISGKNWDQILVIRDDIKMDSHPGWHAALGFASRAFSLDQDSLVVFSVVALFLLFCLMPVFFLERPEGWILALILAAIAQGGFVMRLFFGRPYIVSMAVLLFLCLRWNSLKAGRFPYAAVGALVFLMAISTWMHCSWHLWLVPIFAFFLAREYRAAIRLCVAAASGVLIGALLTGHPVLFLKQSLYHTILAFGGSPLSRMLVSEFQPYGGDVLAVIIAGSLLMWRYMRGAWDIKRVDNPVFILAALSWVLGFFVRRFWLDWGVPAFMIWAALEFQGFLKDFMKEYSYRRIALTAVSCAVLFIALTVDIDGRWTYNLTTEYLAEGDPKQQEWLPGPGGIIYSNDMTVFYQTLFRNPHAPWRYVLGFEPAWMRPDDLEIYRKIQWNYGAAQSFEPWVRKMRPEDRLVLRRLSDNRPPIDGLEWYYAATNTWIGRLPKDKKK